MATMDSTSENGIPKAICGAVTQSYLQGDFTGNVHSNNSTTTTIHNECKHLSVRELIESSGWGSPPGINLDSLCDEHNLPVADTGKWIFKKDEYRRWQESKGSKLLWLCGGPGTGKTMLAKRVATEILGGPSGPSEGVIFGFCFVPLEAHTDQKSADVSQLGLSKVVGGLLHSILEQDGNFSNRCRTKLEEHRTRFFNNTSTLWKALESTIRDCQADLVYILIDGVDGLGKSSGDLIERTLRLMKIGTVKIFLTSRDVPCISNTALSKFPELIRIDLDTTNFVQMHVEAFVRGKLNSWGWNDKLRERAVGALVEKAEGTFLWVSSVIDSLQDSSLGPDFDDLITKPPLGLEAVYGKMLHNLNSRQPSSVVLELIGSVALALRPLTFGELDSLLECNEENADPQPQSFLTGASSKIQLKPEEKIRMYVKSSMGFLRATETTVSLIHHTIIPYLFGENCENCDNACLGLSESETECAISLACFRYLHDVFGDRERYRGRDHEQEPGETPRELARENPQQAVVKQPFLRYAAESWLIHARRIIEISEEDSKDNCQRWLLHQFFDTSDLIRKPWIELCGDSRMEVLAGKQTPLQVAVCLGLVSLVRQILLNITWGTYRACTPPRHIAAKLKAQVKVFARDKAYGKKINKRNRSGNTPLHLATEFNYTEIVKCLVEGGANLGIKNNDQMTALELAERDKRGDILKILKPARPRCHRVRRHCRKPSPFDESDSSNAKAISGIGDYGVQVPLYVPATFGDRVKVIDWWKPSPENLLCNLRRKDGQADADTGEWVFGDAQYREWRESKESKLLWLCGGPGTGKTMLARHVAAGLHKEHDNPSEGVKLGFHFISPQLPIVGNSDAQVDSSRRRLAEIANDLLYNILEQDSKLFDVCKAEFGKQGNRFFTNPISSWGVLRKAIQDCETKPVYILIDGMDGLHESLCEELLGWVVGLMEIGTVKVFLSSRDVPCISNSLLRRVPGYSKVNLDMNNFVKEDVETFITRRVHMEQGEQGDVDMRERAVELLLELSEGNFLSASLAIGGLGYGSPGPDFHELLRQPRVQLGLEGVYRAMLRTLLSHEISGEVMNTIWSVALAMRPVTLSELGHILACIEGKAGAEKRPSSSVAISEIQLKSEEEIIMYIRSSNGFLRVIDATVSIVHHTATEYLFREYSKGSLPVLSQGEADLAIAWECFRYLHQVYGDPKEFSNGDVRWPSHKEAEDESEEELEEESEETPWEAARERSWWAALKWKFLEYAAESWFLHARRSIGISKDTFYDDSTHNWLQHQFFDTSDVIRRPWIELCGDSGMEILVGEQAPLHIAVCLGLTPVAEKVLSVPTKEINSDVSPLHLAAKFSSGACKVLIAGNSPHLLTKQDQNGNTPLHEAVISGHLPMVVSLVGKFATPEYKAYSNQINQQNSCGNTPLHLAIQFDHPEIAEFLFKNGADPTIKNCAHVSASELRLGFRRGDSWGVFKQAGNGISTNTKNNPGVQVASPIPATFEELIWDARWWVSSPEIDLDHLRDEYNLPKADTGRWIFEDGRYRAWRESRESKILWLCGGPGTGKTMLAKCVAAELLREPRDPPGGFKLSLNFVPPGPLTSRKLIDEDRLSQLSLAKVAGSLLYSILVQDGKLFNGCKAELERQGDGFFTDSSSLWSVLENTIRDCQTDPVYILIDGVDRLRGRSQAELIRRILPVMEIRTVKIFLSSRDIPHISDSLLCGHTECTKIDLDINSFVARDVETFITQRVSALGLDVYSSKRAVEAFLAESEGTFLWTSFAIKNLACSSPDFHLTHRNPRPKLHEVYRNMLGSLSDLEESEKVLNVIRNMALVLRPLTFGEFGHILAWMEEKVRLERPPHRGPGSEIRPSTEEEIRVYVRSSMGFLRATCETVSIVHHTAIEFFFDGHGSHRPTCYNGTADGKISWECFQYLNHAFGDPERFQRGTVGDCQNRSRDSRVGQDLQEGERGETQWEVARKDPQEAVAKWPFLRYAAESWLIHARRSIDFGPQTFYGKDQDWLQHQFFDTSDHVRKPWIELCGDPRMEVLAGGQTPLHIAVGLELMPLVKKALSGSTERGPPLLMQKSPRPVAHRRKINEKNGSGISPLGLALQFNHQMIVRFLLRNGADPE